MISCTLTVMVSHAKSINPTNTKQKRLSNQLHDTKQELEATKSKLLATEKELANTKQELSDTKVKLTNVTSALQLMVEMTYGIPNELEANHTNRQKVVYLFVYNSGYVTEGCTKQQLTQILKISRMIILDTLFQINKY